MNGKVSPTIRVLQEIRGELRSTVDRIDGTNTRLERLEEKFGSLERRQVEGEIRISTELVSVGKTLIEMRDLLRDRLDDHHRVDELERRVDSLERRVG